MTNTPSNAEIEKLAAEHLKAFAQFSGAGDVWVEGEVAFARAVLAKWGAPQPAPAPLSEREAFEAWIEKDGGDLGTFGTPPNMHYRNSAVNNAWVAWKARAALAAQGGK